MCQLPFLTKAAVGALCAFNATWVRPGRRRNKVSLCAPTMGSHASTRSAAAVLTRVVRMSSGRAASSTWLQVLPPFCAKPMENVENFLQVFSVVDAQPESLAITVGGKNFLLSKGDQFWVPPFADYSLRNYSSVKEGRLTFVLIKPSETQEADR